MSAESAAHHVHGYYDEESDEVLLLRRRADGVLVAKRRRADWSLYLRAGDLSSDQYRQLRESRSVVALRREGDYLRVRFDSRWTRQAAAWGHAPKGCARSGCDHRGLFEYWGVRHFEADVRPLERAVADGGIEIAKPRLVFVDIETDSRCTFNQAIAGEARVLMWTLVARDTGEVRKCLLEGRAEDSKEVLDRAEADLLRTFWTALEDFDQVAAWGGDRFDFAVLKRRSELLRGAMPKDFRRWLYLDHLKVFDRMNTAAASGDEKQSLALNNICHSLFGEGKEEAEGIVPGKSLGAQTWDLWAAGGAWRELLSTYCVRDTTLLRKLEEKTGFIALFQALCASCRVFPDSAGLNPTAQVDSFMLRLGRERGIHFPSHRYSDEPRTKFAGAYVMQPDLEGVGKDVHVLDFKGMYPSIILSWNMSPETKDPAVPVNGEIPKGRCRAPSTGVGFSTGEEGSLVFALHEMRRLRKEWSEKQASLPPGTEEWQDAGRISTAYKVAANSFYGVIGSPFSRYFDREIAESVTQTGVWLIRQTIRAVTERGWKVVYSDTDSTYVTGPSSPEEFRVFAKTCNADLYPPLLLAQGCVSNYVEIDYEKQFSRICFVAAKKYAGAYSHYKGKAGTAASKPEIKGLEFMRGDCPALARRLQRAVIQKLIVEGEEDPLAFVPMVEASRDAILVGDLRIEDVKSSQSISGSIKSYSQKTKLDGTLSPLPAHVRVAQVMAARGEQVTDGTRIDYYVKDATATPQEVAPASDYAGDVDRYYVWEAKVWPPTQRFLEAAFPRWDWAAYSKVRPKKERKKKEAPVIRQLSLGFTLQLPPGGKLPGVVPQSSRHRGEHEKTQRGGEGGPGPD